MSFLSPTELLSGNPLKTWSIDVCIIASVSCMGFFLKKILNMFIVSYSVLNKKMLLTWDCAFPGWSEKVQWECGTVPLPLYFTWHGAAKTI